MPKTRHIPERSCVACGVKMPKSQLVRVVRTSQGPAAVDATGSAPGRGAYLCRVPGCWQRALEKGSLGRSLGPDLSSQDLEPLRAYFHEHIQESTQERTQEATATAAEQTSGESIAR
ncbi:MAG: YlxR family protein [Chloroflexi bacterium]|nr:YlxR family protein [Chloroflexota bacterium]MDA1272253.1 YlxR family protein [Chloroflexota bacterium]